MYKPTDTTNAEVKSLVDQGWKVISDGPSGTQLEGPKKMKVLDGIVLVLGVVAVFFVWPLGLFFIAIALVDYAVLTKPQTRFVARG